MKLGGIIEDFSHHFKRESWDNIEFVWDHKPFLRHSIAEVMHVPLIDDINTVNRVLLRKALENNAALKEEDILLLRHPVSPWKEEVLLSVSKPLTDNPEYTELTGTFRSMVFEGSPSQLRHFTHLMNERLTQNNEKATAYYIHRVKLELHADGSEYATYVLIAQVENLKIIDQPQDIDMTLPNNLFDA